MRRSSIAVMLVLVFGTLVFLQIHRSNKHNDHTLTEQLLDEPATPEGAAAITPQHKVSPPKLKSAFVPRRSSTEIAIPNKCMNAAYAMYEITSETNLHDVIEDTLANCTIAVDIKEASTVLTSCKTREECELAFAVLRTLLMNGIAKSVPLEAIHDPLLLVERLQLRTEFSTAAREENIAIARRLVELEPDYYPAYKFIAINNYYSLRDAEAEVDHDQAWQEFWKTTETIQQRGFNQDKENRLELEILTIHTKARTEEQMQDMLSRMQNAHPESNVVKYYQGLVAYQTGAMDAAKEKFSECLAKDPGNERYQTALAMTNGQPVAQEKISPEILMDW